jgi:hypothetical protein
MNFAFKAETLFPIFSSKMHPSFGVPWPRLQRAAARLADLHAPRPESCRVHALIFLCGLKYLLTYRSAKGRRLSHYLDDGLREAVGETLPALMQWSAEFRPPVVRAGRISLPRAENIEFDQLVFAFGQLPARLPASPSEWIEQTGREANLVRLSFGMGVSARFAPDSHDFVRRMLEKPLPLPAAVLDVLESFNWHPEWSVALAR